MPAQWIMPSGGCVPDAVLYTRLTETHYADLSPVYFCVKDPAQSRLWLTESRNGRQCMAASSSDIDEGYSEKASRYR